MDQLSEMFMNREALKDQAAIAWSMYRRGYKSYGSKVARFEHEITIINREIDAMGKRIAKRALDRMICNPFDTTGDETLALGA